MPGARRGRLLASRAGCSSRRLEQAARHAFDLGDRGQAFLRLYEGIVAQVHVAPEAVFERGALLLSFAPEEGTGK